MQLIQIPAPHERLPLPTYLAARAYLLENDADAARMLAWSEREVGPPGTAEKMAAEIIWIILCAGRSAQAARTIEQKVWLAIRAGTPVVEMFGYKAKAAAIERAWYERASDFVALQEKIATDDPEQLLAWCKAIPFIGTDTQYQLAKNFGVDVAKPDIWMCRLAGIPDRPRLPIKVRFKACMNLCRFLGEAFGERMATVDSILWLACNKGVLVTDGSAGPISLNTGPIVARSIYVSADDAIV
jgi:hypothetical protein